jgi:hypothetical protein
LDELVVKRPKVVWRKFAPIEENLTPALLEDLEEYGYNQLSQAAIAGFLCITPAALCKLMDEYPQMRESYERGRSKLIADVTKRYIDKVAMLDGHAHQPKALEFILERKGGWKKDPEVAVQINNGLQPLSISDDDLDNALDAEWTQK